MLPYVTAGVGYPGLLLTTLFFVWRFLRSLEARRYVGVEPHAAPSLAGVGLRGPGAQELIGG